MSSWAFDTARILFGFYYFNFVTDDLIMEIKLTEQAYLFEIWYFDFSANVPAWKFSVYVFGITAKICELRQFEKIFFPNYPRISYVNSSTVRYVIGCAIYLYDRAQDDTVERIKFSRKYWFDDPEDYFFEFCSAIKQWFMLIDDENGMQFLLGFSSFNYCTHIQKSPRQERRFSKIYVYKDIIWMEQYERKISLLPRSLELSWMQSTESVSWSTRGRLVIPG